MSRQTGSLILKLLAALLVVVAGARVIAPYLTRLQLLTDYSEFYQAMEWAIVAILIALIIGVALRRLSVKAVAITTIVLALIVGARYFFPVPLPHIQLPAEVLFVIPHGTAEGALKITQHDESTEVPLALGPPR